MGVNLPIKTETFTPPEDMRWLGSSHGTNTADTITLDADSFLATFTDGIVPSGVCLGKVTATGLYRQYVDGVGSTGVETMVGHLFQTVDLGGTTAGTVTDKIPAALYWHGEVIEAFLPTNHGLDAAGKVDVGSRIFYR